MAKQLFVETGKHNFYIGHFYQHPTTGKDEFWAVRVFSKSENTRAGVLSVAARLGKNSPDYFFSRSHPERQETP